MEKLISTITNCLKQVGLTIAENIVVIEVETIESTTITVDESKTLLQLYLRFTKNLNTIFILWKDYTSLNSTAQIY